MIIIAQSLDIAVPAVRQRLSSIARNYAPRWEMAINAGYFETRDSTTSYGLRIFWSRELNVPYPDWPCLVVNHDGTISMSEQSTSISPQSVRHALAIGPVLVRDGRATNINQEIARGRFTGLRPTSVTSRTVVGATADGRIVAGCMNGTMPQVTSALLSRGCVWALYSDGGSSSGMISNSFRVIFGSDTRRLPAALMLSGIQ